MVVEESSGRGATTTSPIKTVVVLVQENRSFDHMLGWMKSLNPEIDGVTGATTTSHMLAGEYSNPISTTNANSSRLFFGDKSIYVDADPGHSIQDIYEQVFGQPWSSDAQNLSPKMEGFAQNAERTQEGLSETVMNGFRPEKVEVYKELVTEFAVCDRWFASMPASTQPNRLYVHSATSHGLTSNDTQKLIEGFPQKTIFESLDEAGFSFGIYYSYPPSTLFLQIGSRPNSSPSPLFDAWCDRSPSITCSDPPAVSTVAAADVHELECSVVSGCAAVMLPAASTIHRAKATDELVSTVCLQWYHPLAVR